eukprot:Selendium_serpulae@DN2953_c0_g1_i1.p1
MQSAILWAWSCLSSRRMITWSHSLLNRKVLYFFQTSRPIVCLTIDDVPALDQEYGKQFLDLCDDHNVKCTLMVISDHLRYDGGIAFLKDAATRGHEIGNHFTSDEVATKYSEADFRRKLLECETHIDEQVVPGFASRPRKWFRPPCGRYSAEMVRVCEEEGYTVVMADVYAHDPIVKDADLIASFCGKAAQPGSIIVVHIPSKNFREWNWRALGILIPELRRSKNFLTLTEASALCADN